MKRLALGSLAVAALAAMSSAQAADMPVKAPAAPIADWAGFYVGVNAGGAWSNVKQFETIVPFSGSGHPNGYFVGATAGYNWQFNQNWVAGIEADFQGSKIDGDVSNFIPGLPDTLNIDYWGTARARLGYAAMEHTLWYVTGGWAWAHVASSFPPGLNFGNVATTFSGGWTIGTGLEYAMTSHWSLKAEYLYMDLGRKALIFPPIAVAPFYTSMTMNVLRAGVNYRW